MPKHPGKSHTHSDKPKNFKKSKVSKKPKIKDPKVKATSRGKSSATKHAKSVEGRIQRRRRKS